MVHRVEVQILHSTLQHLHCGRCATTTTAPDRAHSTGPVQNGGYTMQHSNRRRNRKNRGKSGNGPRARGTWITKERRLAIYRRDNCECVYCGENGDFTLSIDHCVPMSKTTDHTDHNLVTACKKCNQSRGDMPIKKWVNIIAGRTGSDARSIMERVSIARRTRANVEQARALLRTMDFGQAMFV